MILVDSAGVGWMCFPMGFGHLLWWPQAFTPIFRAGLLFLMFGLISVGLMLAEPSAVVFVFGISASSDASGSTVQAWFTSFLLASVLSLCTLSCICCAIVQPTLSPWWSTFAGLVVILHVESDCRLWSRSLLDGFTANSKTKYRTVCIQHYGWHGVRYIITHPFDREEELKDYHPISGSGSQRTSAEHSYEDVTVTSSSSIKGGVFLKSGHSLPFLVVFASWGTCKHSLPGFGAFFRSASTSIVDVELFSII